MRNTLQKKLKKLPQARKQKIKKRAVDLIAEEMTLQDLRIFLSKTQASVAKKLHIKQDGVSRIEHRTDMLLSTLNKYINSMGGELRIIAEFPGKPPVTLQGLLETDQKPSSRASR